MPRPCKRRRVCAEPRCRRFGPIGQKPEKSLPPVALALDEFEAVRLIDLEGLTQEQCAAQMNIARTTVQAIYGSAREKLARCLVHGNELAVGGGDYILCDGRLEGCRCRRCPAGRNHALPKKEENQMRIAVTYENGQIFQHFGHTEFFKIYDVEDNKIVSSAVVSTEGQGHGALAGVLKSQQIDTLICGGIGGGAQNALSQAGIRLYGGVSGDADQAVEALLNGTLAYNPDVKCDHHGEHHHGECGHHEGECGGGHC